MTISFGPNGEKLQKKIQGAENMRPNFILKITFTHKARRIILRKSEQNIGRHKSNVKLSDSLDEDLQFTGQQ